jgi:hypothetical protein
MAWLVVDPLRSLSLVRWNWSSCPIPAIAAADEHGSVWVNSGRSDLSVGRTAAKNI